MNSVENIGTSTECIENQSGQARGMSPIPSTSSVILVVVNNFPISTNMVISIYSINKDASGQMKIELTNKTPTANPIEGGG